MSIPIAITKKEARKLALTAQKIGAKINTLEAIEQLSYVQIDTISVTERAHNHVLFTRNPQFKPTELDQLMKDKSIFEYWSHAAAYLPIKDYRFSLYQKNTYKNGTKHWFPRDKKVEKYVLDRLKTEGPLQIKDFENKGGLVHAWGQLKPAKMAMTNLFIDGTVMISHREKFHKVFDLAERVIPSDIKTAITAEEYARHLIVNSIKAHGVVHLQEIIYLRKGIKKTVIEVLAEMVESRELVSIKIEGLSTLYYTTEEQLQNLNTSLKRTKLLHILNPFDNLIIQRKRVEDLFDFEYLLECYVPEKKRKFGYYTLPILYKDKLVARFDAKADRKKGVFNIKEGWYEKKFKPTDKFQQLLAKELQLYAEFCGCEKLNEYSFIHQ